MPVAQVTIARAYMYMPKKTCHGRRLALLFLEPPGYQKVAKPAAHCPEEVIEKLIYAPSYIALP